eukprot:6101625-Amphidinium_carterae.1
MTAVLRGDSESTLDREVCSDCGCASNAMHHERARNRPEKSNKDLQPVTGSELTHNEPVQAIHTREKDRHVRVRSEGVAIDSAPDRCQVRVQPLPPTQSKCVPGAVRPGLEHGEIRVSVALHTAAGSVGTAPGGGAIAPIAA